MGLISLIRPIVQLFQPPKPPFSAPQTAFFALQEGSFRPAIQAISQRNMAHIAMQYRPYWKTGGIFRLFRAAETAVFFYFGGNRSVNFREPGIRRRTMARGKLIAARFCRLGLRRRIRESAASLLPLRFLAELPCQREHHVARNAVVAQLGAALGVDGVALCRDLAQYVVGGDSGRQRAF